MTKKDCYKLISSIRSNWGGKSFDFDRATRSLAQALIRCKDEEALPAIEATISELEKRQLYHLFKG